MSKEYTNESLTEWLGIRNGKRAVFKKKIVNVRTKETMTNRSIDQKSTNRSTNSEVGSNHSNCSIASLRSSRYRLPAVQRFKVQWCNDRCGGELPGFGNSQKVENVQENIAAEILYKPFYFPMLRDVLRTYLFA
jgi:hypothetical protein